MRWGVLNITWVVFYQHAMENRHVRIKQMQSQSQKGEPGFGLGQIHPELPSLSGAQQHGQPYLREGGDTAPVNGD